MKIKKISTYMIIMTVTAMCASLLQACAGNKQLAKSDFEKIKKVKVVRLKTPDFEVNTVGGAILRSMGGILTVYAGNSVDRRAGKEATKEEVLPDIEQMLVDQFAKRIAKEIVNWPVTVVEKKAVEKDYETKEATLVVFELNKIGISIVDSYYFLGDVTIKNGQGEKIFKKDFSYDSRLVNIKRSREEYLANNCKLLKEEMPIAADYAVNKIINDLKDMK